MCNFGEFFYVIIYLIYITENIDEVYYLYFCFTRRYCLCLTCKYYSSANRRKQG